MDSKDGNLIRSHLTDCPKDGTIAAENDGNRAMNRLKEIQFIKQVGKTVRQWEIRRILKARSLSS
jgi:hypothetical protein